MSTDLNPPPFFDRFISARWAAPALVVAVASALGASVAYDDQKPDPVEANGPIFKTDEGGDWPKPDAVLIFTGEQDGYLEPCGCAGLTNQKGGLKRRHTMLKQLRQKGWPTVCLDGGGLIKRFGQQAQIKYRKAVEALVTLDYAGVGFGDRDLRMDVLGVAINLDEKKNPLTSANIGMLGWDDTLSRKWRTTEAGGVKVGFTSVLADSKLAGLGNNPDLDSRPAAEGLAEVTPQLEAAGCDQLVLLVYGTRAEAESLAKKFPAYDWVVSTVGADEPPYMASKIDGTDAYHIETGHKGMYAVAIGLYAKAGGDGFDFRYQKVPLDHRFEDSPEMQQLLVSYQNELQTFGFDGLGVKPQLHPSAEVTKGEFAGSAKCVDCHEEEFDIWKKTPHSHATQTIVDLQPPRHFDPECLSCHATGWEPQKYYPFVTGYKSLEETPHLVANGCENCHGPAARHVAIENGDAEATDEEIEAIYAALHLEIVENEGNMEGQKFDETTTTVKKCLECHDLDNSPDFDFQQYWPHVAHGSRWAAQQAEKAGE